MLPSQYLLFAKIGLAGALLLFAGWVGHAWTDRHYQAVLARMAADSQKLIADKQTQIAAQERITASLNDKIEQDHAAALQDTNLAWDAYNDLLKRLRPRSDNSAPPGSAQAPHPPSGQEPPAYAGGLPEQFFKDAGQLLKQADELKAYALACHEWSTQNGRTE